MMRTVAMMAALAIGAPAAAQTPGGDSSASPVPAPRGCPSAPGGMMLADGATLPIERQGVVTLGAAARFPVPPGRAPAPGSFGGTLRFAVAAAGTYRVGLGAAVWIDVVKDGKPIASIAHDHQAGCKTVDFPLTSVGVMVVRAG